MKQDFDTWAVQNTGGCMCPLCRTVYIITFPDSSEPGETKTETNETEKSYMILNITVVRQPNQDERLAGKGESILAGPSAVAGQSERAAILAFGRDNAAKLKDVDSSLIQVLVGPVGS